MRNVRLCYFLNIFFVITLICVIFSNVKIFYCVNFLIAINSLMR